MTSDIQINWIVNSGIPPKDKVYYLASPYTNPDLYIQNLNYFNVAYIASELIKVGYTFIEPIASSHPTSLMFKLPGGYEFWKNRDRKFIEITEGVIVVKLPGWNTSVGVLDEINYAKSLGKPVYYLEVLNV